MVGIAELAALGRHGRVVEVVVAEVEEGMSSDRSDAGTNGRIPRAWDRIAVAPCPGRRQWSLVVGPQLTTQLPRLEVGDLVG